MIYNAAQGYDYRLGHALDYVLFHNPDTGKQLKDYFEELKLDYMGQ